MRSIDADALANRIMWAQKHNEKITVLDLIADAPTIDKPVLVMFDVAKWEEDWQEDLDFMSRKGWKCSACGKRQSYGMTPHCPFCGAEMINGSEFQEGE